MSIKNYDLKLLDWQSERDYFDADLGRLENANRFSLAVMF